MQCGVRLAPLLCRGDVLALEGGLGGGKTTFVKGLAQGLGVGQDTEATSPTFVLMHEYTGAKSGEDEKTVLYHMDCYRLRDADEAEAAGLEEFFYMGGVVAVEWADRIRSLLPEHILTIKFKIEDERERSIVFQGDGKRIAHIQKALCPSLS